jgi:hypothetical protein
MMAVGWILEFIGAAGFNHESRAKQDATRSGATTKDNFQRDASTLVSAPSIA